MKIADIVALQGHTVGLDWHIACKLEKVLVRTQSPSVK